MTTITTEATGRRESARQSDGKFGHQHHTESTVSLNPDGTADQFAPPSAAYGEVPKDERAKAMLADLGDAIEKVIEDGKLAQWLDSMRSNGLNRWSFNNRALAMMQLAQRCQDEGTEFPPPAKDVHMMSFKQWKEKDRQVKKGAKAIWILAPSVAKKKGKDGKPLLDEQGQEIKYTYFRAVPVFNITDTEGEPLPEDPIVPPTGQVRPGVLSGLRDRVAATGWSYDEEKIPGCDPESGGGTLGYTTPVGDPRGQRVVVDARLSDAQKASTIAHELAHIKCGHIEDISAYREHRGQMETEAEMTAYLVNRDLGMSAEDAHSFTPGYIASWSKGDRKTVSKAMTKAMKAYQEIVDGQWPDADIEATGRPAAAAELVSA